MTMQSLTYAILADAVQGCAAAIRARTRLQPAGGPGDKVFPPTFGDAIRVRVRRDDVEHVTRYAVEERRIGGESRLCVVLDTVPSQANRMEEALQRAWDAKRLRFPIVRVDFTGTAHEDPRLDLSALGGDGYLTSLETPHRLADAILRDSLLGDLRFRASPQGRAFTEATPHNATAVYGLSPTALVFGMWDSTGPKGGQGAKFQRALVSEIVGVGVEFGRKTSSRIDPVGIELNAGPVYKASDADEEWTIRAEEAALEGKKPVPFSRRKSDKAGKPSSINHGNVKPSIESEAGGVTLDFAEQITVLSLPALRRLRFPKNLAGERIPSESFAAAENSARTSLAALGLAAVALQRDEGYDLRSRCAFVPDPTGPLAFELVDRDGSISGPYTLTPDDAVDLAKQAARAATDAGLAWSEEALDLVPAPKLVELIRKSRLVSASGEDVEENVAT